MITPTIPFLLFLGSVKWKSGDTQVVDQWKPTKQDVLKLRDEMAKFEPKVVNGKKQYQFELYLVSRGVLSFGEYGDWQVINPQEFRKQDSIYSLSQWMYEKDMEALFLAYPEEKVAYQEKIHAMFNDMREVFKSKKITETYA